MALTDRRQKQYGRRKFHRSWMKVVEERMRRKLPLHKELDAERDLIFAKIERTPIQSITSTILAAQRRAPDKDKVKTPPRKNYGR